MTKKVYVTLTLFIFLLFVPFLCFSQELVIFHINDTHSHLYPFGPGKWGGDCPDFAFDRKSPACQWEQHPCSAFRRCFCWDFCFQQVLGLCGVEVYGRYV